MSTTPCTARVASPAEFLFAGKALFTLVSVRTGAHLTYRVTASKDGAMFFVSHVAGGQKSYIGCIPADNRTEFRTTRKSTLPRGHVVVASFEWFLRHIGSPLVELHHAGKCGRCARTLTDPVSIARGIGPECATHCHERSA